MTTPRAAALEGLLGTLRGIGGPASPPSLASLPWPEQLAALRAARAPLPASPPTTTTLPAIYNAQAALLWLDRTTAALGREPSTREILVTMLGGTPSKGELIAFTNMLAAAGAVSRRSGRGRREPLWRRSRVM
jgi:hypothetical protein